MLAARRGETEVEKAMIRAGSSNTMSVNGIPSPMQVKVLVQIKVVGVMFTIVGGISNIRLDLFRTVSTMQGMLPAGGVQRHKGANVSQSTAAVQPPAM